MLLLAALALEYQILTCKQNTTCQYRCAEMGSDDKKQFILSIFRVCHWQLATRQPERQNRAIWTFSSSSTFNLAHKITKFEGTLWTSRFYCGAAAQWKFEQAENCWKKTWRSVVHRTIPCTKHMRFFIHALPWIFEDKKLVLDFHKNLKIAESNRQNWIIYSRTHLVNIVDSSRQFASFLRIFKNIF
jgi:hypothetical protein